MIIVCLEKYWCLTFCPYSMLNDTRCVITLVGDSLISGMYRDGEIHITFNGCEGAGVSL